MPTVRETNGDGEPHTPSGHQVSAEVHEYGAKSPIAEGAVLDLPRPSRVSDDRAVWEELHNCGL